MSNEYNFIAFHFTNQAHNSATLFFVNTIIIYISKNF